MRTGKLLILGILSLNAPMFPEALYQRSEDGYVVKQCRSITQNARDCAAHATFNALSFLGYKNSNLLDEIKKEIPCDSHSKQISNYLKKHQNMSTSIQTAGLPEILRSKNGSPCLVILDYDLMSLLQEIINFSEESDNNTFIDGTEPFISYLKLLSNRSKKTVFIYHIFDHWISFQVELQNDNCIVTVLNSTNAKSTADATFDFFALLKMDRWSNCCQVAKTTLEKQKLKNAMQERLDFEATPSTLQILKKLNQNYILDDFENADSSSNKNKKDSSANNPKFIFGGIISGMFATLCCLKKEKKKIIVKWKTKLKNKVISFFKKFRKNPKN